MEMTDMQQIWSGITTHSVERVSPGVWRHTFIPTTMQDEPTVLPADDIGNLAKDAIERLLAAYGFADISFSVSPTLMARWHRLMLLKRLHQAHPLPRRKIRKCHLRKRTALMGKGKAHIRRVEQRRAEREARMMGGTV